MRACSHRSFATIVCFLGLSLLGICLAPLVPLRENAPASMGAGTAIITVSFPAIGARPPAVVEAAATHVVEAALNRVAGVGHIDSYSDSYGGSVSLQLSPTADPDGARLEVATTLRRLWHSMPHWAGYPNVSVHYIGSQAGQRRPVMVYTISGPGSAKVVSDYADRHIRPALVRSMGKELNGVDISPNVHTPKATIIYSPDALNNYGLSSRDIAAAVSAYTSTGRGHNFVGYARGSVAPEPVFLSTATPAGRGIESARVKLPGGGDIALGEVARAAEAEQTQYEEHLRIDGQNAVRIALFAHEDANYVRLGTQIRKCMDAIAAAMPRGYKLKMESDATAKVGKEARGVAGRFALSVALLLLSIVVAPVMGRNPRFLLVVVAALAANVAIAFAVYRVAGIGIQIYSLAGMAVSLGIVAGNILVMAAHLAGQRGSRSFFTAILASTLTTVAPLVAIDRLGKGVGPDLADFATITIVNLMVSLAVCLLLVPALMEVLGVERAVATRRRRPGRSTVRAMRAYSAFIAFTLAHRRAMVVLAVLAFGTPLFMLPHHIGSDDYTEGPPSPYVRLYNATIGSKAYEAVRQYSDPLLGGALRPFMMRYVEGRYDESPDDKSARTLEATAILPPGTGTDEADKTCAAMERLLMNQGGAGAVENITTEYSAGHGTITCTFSPAAAERGLPAKVYSLAVARAGKIGNANWAVRNGNKQFNNIVGTDYRQFHISLVGYNYARLMEYTEKLAARLRRGHSRMNNLQIAPYGYGDQGSEEETVFSPLPGSRMLAAAGATPAVAIEALAAAMPRPMEAGGYTIRPENARDYFSLVGSPMAALPAMKPAQTFAVEEQRRVPGHIVRHDQSYMLTLGFDYTGDIDLAYRIARNEVEQFNRSVPKGYSAEIDYMDGNGGGKHGDAALPIAAVALAIVAIYLVGAVLLNSLRLPLAIVSVIPFAFIGLMVGDTLAGIPSGEGVTAAMLLVGGLACNAPIYILNDYSALARRLPPQQAYLKAFGGKIVPIVLSVVSTAASFLPFMIESPAGSFWLSVSVGTVAGLVASIVGTVVFMPAFFAPSRQGRGKAL